MQLSFKNDLATFWAILGEIGLLFISSSGYTGLLLVVSVVASSLGQDRSPFFRRN